METQITEQQQQNIRSNSPKEADINHLIELHLDNRRSRTRKQYTNKEICEEFLIDTKDNDFKLFAVRDNTLYTAIENDEKNRFIAIGRLFKDEKVLLLNAQALEHKRPNDLTGQMGYCKGISTRYKLLKNVANNSGLMVLPVKNNFNITEKALISAMRTLKQVHIRVSAHYGKSSYSKEVADNLLRIFKFREEQLKTEKYNAEIEPFIVANGINHYKVVETTTEQNQLSDDDLLKDIAELV